MHSRIKNQIIDWAKANPKEEICGLLYYSDNKLLAVLCENIARDKSNEFQISHEIYLKYEMAGTLCGVFHSHPDGPAAFSEADIEYIQEVAVPLYLYVVESGSWLEYIPPTYHVDTIGLPFIWGLYDCYSTARNHFRQECGVYLGDYDRDEDVFRTSGTKTMIVDNLRKEGFSIIGSFLDNNLNLALNSIQKHDIILFTNPEICRQSSVHVGIFLGNSKFLHHPENALSRSEMLTDHWVKRIRFIIRHKSQIKNS